MTKSIALIGCGNIGSRHLQSLIEIPFDTNIDIFEPNKNAQLLAKELLNESKYVQTQKDLHWYNSLTDIQNHYDLIIVATPSSGRVNLIRQLLDSGNDRFLVEKMVCQSTHEYDELLTQMKKFSAKCWVNTNRKYFHFYKQIKNLFEKNPLKSFSVVGSGARLGTSAIHYIDLFCWIAGNYKIHLDGSFLTNKLFPNKRGSHFKEFAGTIIGSLKDETMATITFLPNSNIPTVLNIINEDNHIIIDETNEKIIYQKTPIQSPLKFSFQHTSELTKYIVKDIFGSDSCSLTTVEDLYNPHRELFRIFNNHIKKITNEESVLCPIT